MAPLRLRHIHLPPPPNSSYPTYACASHVQALLRREQLFQKESPSATPGPPPTLLSFTPTPTYTMGRRQTGHPLAEKDLDLLRQPLRVLDMCYTISGQIPTFTPVILPSPRGGLATYHGPGQLVLWPILDLRPSSNPDGTRPYASFTVRCWTACLEQVTISLLANRFHLPSATTDPANPGVWLPGHPPSAPAKKIAAVGTHIRRHISSLGTALVLDLLRPAPASFLSWPLNETMWNPWARFAPCGLQDRGVTSLRDEISLSVWTGLIDEWWSLRSRRRDSFSRPSPLSDQIAVREVMADLWAAELARRIGLPGDGADAVERINDPEAVRRLVEELEAKFGGKYGA